VSSDASRLARARTKSPRYAAATAWGLAVDAELAEDVLAMRSDRLLAEREVRGDLTGIESLGQRRGALYLTP
jgi:hypothetical protein